MPEKRRRTIELDGIKKLVGPGDELVLYERVREGIKGIEQEIAAKAGHMIFEAFYHYFAKKLKELRELQLQLAKNSMELIEALAHQCRACGGHVKDKQELTQCPSCKSPICQKCLAKIK